MQGGSGKREVSAAAAIAIAPAAPEAALVAPAEGTSVQGSSGPSIEAVAAAAHGPLMGIPGVAAAVAEYEWERTYGTAAAPDGTAPGQAFSDTEAPEARTRQRHGKARRPVRNKVVGNDLINEKGRLTLHVDTPDIIAFFSGLIALCFTFAMIAGKLEITDGTLGVVGFTGLQTAIFGVKSVRNKKKAR